MKNAVSIVLVVMFFLPSINAGWLAPISPTSPTPSPTATPVARCFVRLNQKHFTPGDPFELSILTESNFSETIYDVPLLCVLDINGAFFFGPQWNEFSYYSIDLRPLWPGWKTVFHILDFQWPSNCSSGSGVQIHAALVSEDFSEIIGLGDSCVFSWSE